MKLSDFPFDRPSLSSAARTIGRLRLRRRLSRRILRWQRRSVLQTAVDRLNACHQLFSHPTVSFRRRWCFGLKQRRFARRRRRRQRIARWRRLAVDQPEDTNRTVLNRFLNFCTQRRLRFGRFARRRRIARWRKRRRLAVDQFGNAKRIVLNLFFNSCTRRRIRFGRPARCRRIARRWQQQQQQRQ